MPRFPFKGIVPLKKNMFILAKIVVMVNLDMRHNRRLWFLIRNWYLLFHAGQFILSAFSTIHIKCDCILLVPLIVNFHE